MTMDNTWFASMLLSGMAVLNVSLWTLRVTFAARGLRIPASTVAALEALLFTIAFSHVSSHLGSPARVGAYALGVAAGTYVGIAVDDRLSSTRSPEERPALEVPDDFRPYDGLLHDRPASTSACEHLSD